MEKCDKVAALLIASLKSLYLLHQHNHWNTSGANFYSNHLLFQRLYEAAAADLDLIAEKFIGVFGNECMDYSYQVELLNKVMLKYKNTSQDDVATSLQAEKDFIKLCDEAYKCFGEHNKLTLGLEDAIPAITSKREEAVYLLQQIRK